MTSPEASDLVTDFYITLARPLRANNMTQELKLRLVACALGAFCIKLMFK